MTASCLNVGLLLRTGSTSAKVHFHAGMIRYRLGDKNAAKKNLTHALAENPRFSVLDADVARKTLQELSQ